MTPFSRIHHLLEHHATHAPDATALVTGTQTRTGFANWLTSARDLAELLRREGVTAGDRVMMIAENSFTLAASLMAASMLDAWSVPVNARLSSGETDRICTHAEPAVIIFTTAVSDNALAHARAAGARAIMVGHEQAMILKRGGTCCEPVDAGSSQVATLLYTTGTTGDPKGVMLTHANLLAAGEMSAGHRGINPDDHVYGVLPLTHVFGLSSVFMAALWAGASFELVPRFDTATTFENLREHVTIFPAVPQMHANLMAHAAEHGLKQLDAKRLKYISSGGAPLDLAWKQKVEAFFGLPLFNGYGLTETSAGIAATRPGAARQDTSCGKALGGQEIIIAGKEADGIGEVVVRGPNVMKGYYRNEAATRAVLDDEGWFRTGDLGFLDADGNLHITGRSKELIIRSGFNVYPLEVEAALNSHEHVVQSAVIGHSHGGNEDIIAFVQPAMGASLTSEILKAHLADRLAAYKHPNRWIISMHLPAAPSGKILKARLTSVFEQELALVLGE